MDEYVVSFSVVGRIRLNLANVTYDEIVDICKHRASMCDMEYKTIQVYKDLNEVEIHGSKTMEFMAKSIEDAEDIAKRRLHMMTFDGLHKVKCGELKVKYKDRRI